MGLDAVGLDVVGFDVVGLDVVGLDVVGLDVVGFDVVGLVDGDTVGDEVIVVGIPVMARSLSQQYPAGPLFARKRNMVVLSYAGGNG